MDAIKGTMTEIYNDLSKNTTGSTIAEVRDDTCTPFCYEGFLGAEGWPMIRTSLQGPGPSTRRAQLMGVVGEGVSSLPRQLLYCGNAPFFFVKQPRAEPELTHW